MKLVFSCLLSLVLVSFLQSSTEACRCIEVPTLEKSYFHAEKVLLGKVLKVYDCSQSKKGPCTTSNFRFYEIQVLKSYKGCLEPKSNIVINTPNNSCGAFLSKGKKYLLNIGKDRQVEFCDYIVEESNLKPTDEKLLEKQPQCCK